MTTRRGPIVLAVVLVVAIGIGVLLSSRVEPAVAFDIDSTRPDGLGAVKVLLEQQGVEVLRAPASSLTGGELEPDGDSAVVMIAPSVASEDERAALQDRARAGATVVFGEQVVADDLPAFSAVDDAMFLGGRTLPDEPPFPVATGNCDIDELVDLGPIDAAFSAPMTDDGAQRCYEESGGANFLRRAEGAGTVVTISSPFLWVNARLQPRKEEGGEPLANGATAVRLLGDERTVTFIDPVPSADAVITGDQDPVTLLPLPVKLALAQLLGAFVLYVWWRSRRLGRPVTERLPVEVAGSELTAAVGDLLRRRGNPQRAAAAIRGDTRRVLGARLGMGADPSPVALVEVVAARTGRAPDEVGAALYGDRASPVDDATALVALVRTLDAIRQEVLHVDAR